MAYNQTNLLMDIEEAQSIWLEHQKDERTNVWIYKKYIYPRFRISIKTFYNWLSRNVAKERRELQEKADAAGKQLSLFEDEE